MYHLATWLLLYHALYWLYLLHIGGTWSWQGFPYAIFRLSLLTSASGWFRLLWIGCLLRIHEAKLTTWHQTQRYFPLVVTSCAVLLFLFFDQVFDRYAAPYAFPVLLITLLLLPICWGAEDSFTIDQPRAKRSAIVLPARNGALPIANPQRGILILGNQGSGKTRFVRDPLGYRLTGPGHAGRRGD